jgi:hypothetical protein
MSEWTVNNLKEHFEKILSEKDKAINIALAAAKEAVGVAETNAEKWRSNANEWRGAMTDREKTFMPRSEFEAYKTSAEKALTVEKDRGNNSQSRGTAFADIWKISLGALGAAGIIYGFIK